MDKKFLALLNFIFVAITIFLNLQNDQYAVSETLSGFIILLTLVNLFDYVFDKYQLLVTQVITFIIGIFTFLQLFIFIID